MARIKNFSTFAWYAASASATVAAGTAKDNSLSVADPNYGLGTVALPVNVAFSRVTDGSDDAVAGALELTQWFGSTPTVSGDVIEINDLTTGWTPALAAGLYAGALDSGSKIHLYDETHAQASHKYVAVYKAHIEIGTPGVYGDINWTEAAMKQELAKRKCQIDLSAAKYVEVAVNDAYDASATYVTLFEGTATPVTPTNDGSKVTATGFHKLVTDTTNGRIRFLGMTDNDSVTRGEGATTHTLDEISLAGIASGVDVYFGVRVQALDAAETGYVYAPFTATVADDGAIAG